MLFWGIIVKRLCVVSSYFQNALPGMLLLKELTGARALNYCRFFYSRYYDLTPSSYLMS